MSEQLQDRAVLMEAFRPLESEQFEIGNRRFRIRKLTPYEAAYIIDDLMAFWGQRKPPVQDGEGDDFVSLAIFFLHMFPTGDRFFHLKDNLFKFISWRRPDETFTGEVDKMPEEDKWASLESMEAQMVAFEGLPLDTVHQLVVRSLMVNFFGLLAERISQLAPLLPVELPQEPTSAPRTLMADLPE